MAPIWSAHLLAVQAPWQALQPGPPCGRLKGELALPLPCVSAPSEPLVRAPLSVARPSVDPDVRLPGVRDRKLGGFMNFDVMEARHLRAGPQVSWLTPESPREDLLRLRVVASGWGVRYTLEEAAVSVGVAACTRFVMLGEDWPVVDMLTSEARIEFLLP